MVGKVANLASTPVNIDCHLIGTKLCHRVDACDRIRERAVRIW